ncbi:MAG: PAS domain S-box protein, partial [Desulfobacteraceae bacterium]|nr:PAS domain S-box protein [Desulfobacteraceae bacterium]
KDGHKVPVLIGAGPRFDKQSGEFLGTMGVVNDITERKHMEDALQEKTTFLQNIIDTTSDLVSVTDMEGNFKFVGPSHKFLGYDPDSLVGRNVMELVHPDDYQKTATAFAEFLANREDGRKVEYRYRRADGDYLWFETVGKFILDDVGNPKEILFSTRDFTARIQAIEALEQREAFIKATLDNLPVGVAVNSVDPKVHFTYMNENFATFYRTTREALAAPNDFWEVVYTDATFREEIKKRVLEDCASNDPERMQWEDIPVSRPGRKPFYITAKNIPLPEKDLMVSTVWDVTERKLAEEALRESEARFKALHNASFGGIAIHDQGIILECNQGLSEITGYQYSELIGMNGLLLIAEKSRETVMNNIQTGYEKPYEAFGLRKNGEEFPMQLEARNIPYKGKQVRTVEFRDITERKRTEEELKRSEENYRLLVENQTDLVVKVDLDGRFLFVSPSYCCTFNKKETEILGKHFMPLVHEDDREPTAKAMETLFSPPHTAYIE